MDERNNDFDFDFTPIGLAIKKARTAQGMTREQLARIVDYDPRHLQAMSSLGNRKHCHGAWHQRNGCVEAGRSGIVHCDRKACKEYGLYRAFDRISGFYISH